MGVLSIIDSLLLFERSSWVVLEEILRDQFQVSTNAALSDLKALILVGAWYIWWQRSELVKGEQLAPPGHTAFSIQALTANYGGAQANAVPKEVWWCKPKPNTYKLNIDACFCRNRPGAAGAIVQNEKGQAISGSSCTLDNLIDATTAEAYALQKGLQLTKQIGCLPVIIETGFLEFVQAEL